MAYRGGAYTSVCHWPTRLIILLVVLDGAVIVLFGSFLLSRIIVKPLKTLVRATEGIARGEYDQTILVGDGNEIGKLADSFNEMTHRLRESQRDVEEYVRSLEIANQRLQQTQMELIRSEKLASIGRFAAGVAHEVGNPLGAILGYTSILQQGIQNQTEGLDYLGRIEVEIQRINKIIRELLDFSRPSPVEIREVDLNTVIEDCLSLLSYQRSFKNIQPSLQLRENIPPVQADESQIQQVFVNLIINAVDAMSPDGGTLTLQTDDYILQNTATEYNEGSRRRRDDPEQADYSHLRRSQRTEPLLGPFPRGKRIVRARVTDTGCGIQAEDLEKIFDPFFTTKDPDRGTGLGLSVSMRILESFGGKIEVVSEVGKGSTFSVLLPASRDERENNGRKKGFGR
jgi:two-component system NtrC family sensor kinase